MSIKITFVLLTRHPQGHVVVKSERHLDMPDSINNLPLAEQDILISSLANYMQRLINDLSKKVFES